MEHRTDPEVITLTLDGSLAEGVRVTLAGKMEIRGYLPAQPHLQQDLNHWRQVYQSIQETTRITPREILYQGAVQIADHCRQASHTLQTQFECWLNSSEFLPIDRQLRESLRPDQPLSLMIRADDWEIYRLPWHHWDFVDRHPQVAIAFSALTRALPTAPPQPQPKARVQILAIFGSSVGLDLSVDRDVLQNLNDAEVTILEEPRRSQLNDALWDHPWDIICFSGHSHTQEQQGRVWINREDHLTLDELRYGLRKACEQGLKLALFNSCDGLGLAKDLLALNLPQIVVMREPIPDMIAHRFLADFLAAYAMGNSLSQAHRLAQERLQGLEQEYPCASWLPILFENEPALPWSALLTAQPLLQPSTTTLSWKNLLLSGLLGSAIALGSRSIGLLENWELQAFDQFARMSPAESTDDRLLLVTIDDEDLRYQDQQGMQLTGSLAPEALKTLITKLRPLEPISIGLDLYRTQPLKLPDDIPIFGICKVPAAQGGDRYGVDPPPDLPAAFVGFSDFIVDDDNHLRRQLLAIKNEVTTSSCAAQNSVNFLLATHYLQTTGQTYQLNTRQELDWGEVVWQRLAPNAGGYQQIDAAGYQLLLHYRGHQIERVATQISLRDFLSDQVPDAVLQKLKQRIILVGSTASSTGDRWRTPLHRSLKDTSPGLYLQAHMVSQLIRSVEDGRSLIRWWPEWQEGLWIVGWSVGAGLLFRLKLRAALAGVALLSLGLGLVCYVGFMQAWWLPWIPVLLGFLTTALLILVLRRRLLPLP